MMMIAEKKYYAILICSNTITQIFIVWNIKNWYKI